MTDLRRMTYDELAREAKRRGLRVTRESVSLTPEEDRAIRLLVLAAELFEDNDALGAGDLALKAQREAVGVNDWLWEFARLCSEFGWEW